MRHRARRNQLKRAFDVIVASTALLVLLPLLLLIAGAVLVDSGRPVLFRQTRIGQGGRRFQMLKFRTMVRDAEALGANVSPHGDLRVTRLGRLLRRWYLDEFPQLLNVVRGEMSLIGPRPERPEYVEQFERHVYRYSDRHRVKPGITGWAQIHGLRGKSSLADRVEWDNYYIENWSLWLDVKIALLTLLSVLRLYRATE